MKYNNIKVIFRCPEDFRIHQKYQLTTNAKKTRFKLDNVNLPLQECCFYTEVFNSEKGVLFNLLEISDFLPDSTNIEIIARKGNYYLGLLNINSLNEAKSETKTSKEVVIKTCIIGVCIGAIVGALYALFRKEKK